MSKFEISANAGYVADWTIVDAVREFFQNALDQQTVEPDNEMFFNYDGEHLLQIGNKKSILTARTLLFGTTTKKDEENTIGQFGEGYKIATLVALRCGKKVIFYNYGKKEIWKPRMVKSRRYEGEEILTFFTQKFIWKQPPDNNLTIEIDGITPEEYNLIKESNLHLQDDIGEVIETTKGKILLDTKMAKRIFVNGLYVRTEENMTYGYNIKPNYLKLDRDRKMVSSFDLKWFTSQMWSEVKNQEVIKAAMDGADDVSCLDVFYKQTNIVVSNSACESFRATYGEKAIPVTSQAQLEDTQERYQDAKPVLVSAAYKAMIEQAPQYVVKAKPKVAITKEERLLMWYKMYKNIIPSKARHEFLDILGKIDEEDTPI